MKEKVRQLTLPLRVQRQKFDFEENPLGYLRSLTGREGARTFEGPNLWVLIMKYNEYSFLTAEVDIFRPDNVFLEGYIINDCLVKYSGTNWPTVTGFIATPRRIVLGLEEQSQLYFAQATPVARFVKDFIAENKPPKSRNNKF